MVSNCITDNYKLHLSLQLCSYRRFSSFYPFYSEQWWIDDPSGAGVYVVLVPSGKAIIVIANNFHKRFFFFKF